MGETEKAERFDANPSPRPDRKARAAAVMGRQPADLKKVPVSRRKANAANALSANEMTAIFSDAVSQDIELKRKKGLPIARYDPESGQAYLESQDGSRVYV